jgi:hypothetical protein
LPWLGIRASACYENDIYLFFRHYRVNGALLSADVCFRWWRLTASLGTNMDYYFAPMVDRRIHGWHVDLGFCVLKTPKFDACVSIGRINRVDPRLYAYALKGYAGLRPAELILTDMPSERLQFWVRWRP